MSFLSAQNYTTFSCSFCVPRKFSLVIKLKMPGENGNWRDRYVSTSLLEGGSNRENSASMEMM